MSKNIGENELQKLAEMSNTATGAEIANIVNEAATNCFGKDKEFIDKEELEFVCSKNIKDSTRFKKFEMRNNLNNGY